METSIQGKATIFLQSLVGKPLLYALKSPDTELYDFGFGEFFEAVNRRGKKHEVPTYALHVLCRFKVIWRNGVRRVDKYYEDTPCEEFHSDAKRFIGLKVRRIELVSDENDLWLDLGDYWIVFATFQNGEESWRFFFPYNDSVPHLVASGSWLEFQ